MSSEISLTDMQRNKQYKISHIDSDSDYSGKLEKLGFTPGVLVELGSSTIKDPVTIKIRGSRIALRKKEAHIILVKELIL